MPATKDDACKAPDDPNMPIWHYMDFTKYESMLKNQGLFFCRVDHLGKLSDPFEGSFPESHRKEREEFCRFIEETPEKKEKLYKWIRKNVLVTCWHMNSYESAAMWKLYSEANKGVAICSTYAKLDDALDDTCVVGIVRYIDYDKESISANNYFTPFLHKRISYEHEKELRALTRFPPTTATGIDLNYEPTELGRWKNVKDLSALITQVRVAPGCEEWFVDLVKKVTERYSLNISVEQSSLDRDPFY